MGTNIEKIDQPETPFRLEPGDVLVQSSDGIQSLSNSLIEKIVDGCADDGSKYVTEAVFDAIEDLNDPDQDNMSFTVVRYLGLEDGEEFEVAWDPPELDEPSHANNDGPADDQSPEMGATG